MQFFTPNKQQQEEDPNDYYIGGYHPVKNNDIFIDRYHVIRKLGWGSFSTVWLCWDQFESDFAAVKIMKSESMYTKAAKREIELLKRAGNRNNDDPRWDKVVKLLNDFKLTGVNGTHICLVFEVVDDNLSSLIVKSNNRGIPLLNVRRIIKQVLECLDYLHTKCNIIHTDIKPDNILICRDKQKSKSVYDVLVKVADFGNACWVDRHFSQCIQARPYRCPEVILGAGYGPSADIWSVACLAFELATGDYLFDAKGTEDYSQNDDHLGLMIKLLGEIPKDFVLSGKYSRVFFTEKGELQRIKVKFYGLFKLLIEKYCFDEDEASDFVEFLLPMLEFNPHKRASAHNCTNHSWLQF